MHGIAHTLNTMCSFLSFWRWKGQRKATVIVRSIDRFKERLSRLRLFRLVVGGGSMIEVYKIINAVDREYRDLLFGDRFKTNRTKFFFPVYN